MHVTDAIKENVDVDGMGWDGIRLMFSSSLPKT
jgi:hypothetical protein